MRDKLEELMTAMATLRDCLREIGPDVDISEIVLKSAPISGRAISELQMALKASPSFVRFQARLPGADMLAYNSCAVMGVTIREAASRSERRPGVSGDLHIIGVAMKKGDCVVHGLAPKRHHHLVEMLDKAGDDTFEYEQGFLLACGMFVGRERAARIELATGQATKLTAPPELFSEDLW